MLEQIEFSRSSLFETFIEGLAKLGPANAIVHGIFIDLHPLRQNSSIKVAHPPYLDNRIVSFQSPLMVRLCVLPPGPYPPPFRSLIEEYARSQKFLVVVVEEPMAVLAASIEGGGEIGASQPGTIGGFLEDGSGKCWGVTCGHVAQSPNTPVTLESSTGAKIANAGTIRYSNFGSFIPQPQTAFCSHYAGSGHLPVDAGLFEIDSNHHALCAVKSVGKTSAIYDRTQFGSGSTVSMYGALSQLNTWDVGGFGYTTKVEFSGKYYCFSDVFDFQAPSIAPPWLPGRIVTAMAPRPLLGDSGSWLCLQLPDQTYAYVGNMIAVKGLNGIATFADALIAWADKSCGLKLHPF